MWKHWEGKSVVLDEHTLGVVYGSDVQIMRTLVLRGSPHPVMGLAMLPLESNSPRVRLATKQDYEYYRVQWHPEYTA